MGTAHSTDRQTETMSLFENQKHRDQSDRAKSRIASRCHSRRQSLDILAEEPLILNPHMVVAENEDSEEQLLDRSDLAWGENKKQMFCCL